MISQFYMHGELYKTLEEFAGQRHSEPIADGRYALVFELTEIDVETAKYVYTHISFQGLQ
mgnify:CR=1 FL=1